MALLAFSRQRTTIIFLVSIPSTTCTHRKKIAANKNRSILPVLIAKIIIFYTTVVLCALGKILNILDNINEKIKVF